MTRVGSSLLTASVKPLLYLEKKKHRSPKDIDMAREPVKAVAYLRTSSAANVGADKDSDKRQRASIEAFARAHGYELVDEFYDAAVSGADPIDQRSGFMDMLHRVASNGAKTIIVESPDRFARDLAVQLAGHNMLKAEGIALVPASAPDFFLEDTPTAVLVRQVLGAIAQFEKASTVAKLAAARKRKREVSGKCEGRKSHAEERPEVVALVRRLRRRKPKGGQMTLRAISVELASAGHVNELGRPFSAKSVRAMLAGRLTRQ
jgi:DNA invertase Pin-like site-specific DNA recombinase